MPTSPASDPKKSATDFSSEEAALNGYNHLAEMLENAYATYQPQTAFVHMSQRVSYAEIGLYSHRFAAYLQQELGLSRGDRLAVQMPNVLAYPVVVSGALKAGAVLVGVNPLYTPSELHYVLKDARPKVLVVLDMFADKVEKALAMGLENPPAIVLVSVADLHRFPKRMLIRFVLRYIKRAIPRHHLKNACTFKHALFGGAKVAFSAPKIQRDDTAFLQYTGGTTGVPKGAVLTHGNVLSNVLQMRHWGKNLDAGKEVVVTALPLYHIFALTVNYLFTSYIGSKNLLITNPRDTKAMLADMRSIKMTMFTAVSTLLERMLDFNELDRIDFSSMRLCVAGGMALHPDLAVRWKQRTGVELFQGYGLSETSPAICMTAIDENRDNCVGKALTETELLLVDENNKSFPAGTDKVGELCVRGPQVMKGYWEKEQETKDAFYKDFFRTGDLARIDEKGFVYLVDRKKDTIIISGLNVHPSEIERVLEEHPKVKGAGVRGFSDSEGKEYVHAFVIPRDRDVSQEELGKHCDVHLARYKCPKQIHFVEDLPKSNIGKVLRRKLELPTE